MEKFNFTDIDQALATATPASSIKDGNGSSKFKNVKVIDSNGKYHSQISYPIDANTKSKIADDIQLFEAVGYTITDETRVVEERTPMDFSKLGKK